MPLLRFDEKTGLVAGFPTMREDLIALVKEYNLLEAKLPSIKDINELAAAQARMDECRRLFNIGSAGGDGDPAKAPGRG